MQDYFNEVNTLIEELEVNKKVREYKDNSDTLRTYWSVGKLIVDAQKSLKATKYGFLKYWGELLSQKYGTKYNYTNLSRMRLFYICFLDFAAVRQNVSWTQYKSILPIKNENERNYYINQVILNNLSSRDLDKLIKSKAFDRLSYADKENIKLISDTNIETLTINDMIKDPILIKASKTMDNLSEKALHKYIIDMLEDKFLELGTGFALIAHEYKFLLNNKTYRIDLLFFNIELNSYVVIEIKTRELQHRDISQLQFYVNYINRNLKRINHNKTIGILIVKKKNTFVIEYTISNDLYFTTYELVK